MATSITREVSSRYNLSCPEQGYKFVVDAEGSSNYVMVTDKGM
jgi:hypothetical protein